MNTGYYRGIATCSAVIVAGLACLPPRCAVAEEPPAYAADVAPILEKHCYECHGPDDRKGGLRLSNETDALLGGDSHASPFASDENGIAPMIRRITSEDKEVQMPPKGPRVSPAEVAILKAWIEAGAPFGNAGSAPGTPAKEVFWSVKAPVQSAPPATEGWGRNGIDAFVFQTMKSKGLSPSPEADRNTLIRRLSLDLRGLPPAPEEVRRFVADQRPDAYEALVEDFLRSPHFGERMAIDWLDVARYADTNGYEKDRARSIWPYRDWVINAFNENMPFDRFVIEQIAGDMLPSPTLDQRIATGFFRNEMLNEEGGIDVAEFRYKNVVDRTNTVSTALLGLTMSCAQCHSHKYDPISQREYFQLYAFLNNTDDVTLEVPDPAVTDQREKQLVKIAELKTALRGKFPIDSETGVYGALAAPEASASEGGTLTVDPDQTVRIANAAPEKNTYVVSADIGPGRVDGLRLTVLPGERGTGRADNGNFVLSEFAAWQLDPASPDTRTSLSFGSAESDYAQDQYPIAAAIDGKLESGWAVGGDPRGGSQPQKARFYFATPLELAEPLRIEVHLAQEFGQSHTLGDFNLETIRQEIPTANQSDEQRRELHFAKEYAKWSEVVKTKARPWANLTPIDMQTQKFTVLKRLEDNSILATGDLPNNDIYDLALRTDEEHVTGLRLEVLPDKTLPGGGPGRGVILSEGDFLLTEVKISAAPWNNPEAKVPLTVARATESFADAGKTADMTLDGRADTGWSIKGGEGKAHGAVFAFDKPAGFPGGTIFYVTLEQKYIHQHTIGRFRIMTTGAPDPESAGVPAEIESMLLVDAPDETVLQQYFLEHTPLLAEAQLEIAKLEKTLPKQPTTLALEEREQVRIAHIQHRGEFLQPKAAVQPDVPEVLPRLPEFAPRNRLTLARWIVSEENPLTARVTMNRTWQQIFGRGLVRTTEDFGVQGEAPSHPELLDWLAVEFMRRGWNVKDMVRLMVTSATYRQSAKITPEQQQLDPQNIYLARSPRYRVDAEFVRDIALAASGSLNEAVGGPSVFPPLPEGLLDMVYGGSAWKADEGDARQRRGMYTYWKRMLTYPTAAVFDAPARDMVCVRRLRTNTPMQALTLLNDDVFMEAARSMARSLIAETASDPSLRLRELFLRCVAREPDAAEEKALLAYLKSQQVLLRQQPAEQIQALVNGQGGVEEAAWTLLCRAVLNLDETITRG